MSADEILARQSAGEYVGEVTPEPEEILQCSNRSCGEVIERHAGYYAFPSGIMCQSCGQAKDPATGQQLWEKLGKLEQN